MNIGDILSDGRNIVVVVKVGKLNEKNNVRAIVIKNKNKNISITGVGRGFTHTDLTTVNYGGFLRAVANEAMKMFNKTSKHSKLNVQYK
jgi:hypothetical protein